MIDCSRSIFSASCEGKAEHPRCRPIVEKLLSLAPLKDAPVVIIREGTARSLPSPIFATKRFSRMGFVMVAQLAASVCGVDRRQNMHDTPCQPLFTAHHYDKSTIRRRLRIRTITFGLRLDVRGRNSVLFYKSVRSWRERATARSK